MAKNNGSQPPKGGSTDWMDAFTTPTRGQYMRWKRGQEGQYTPTINTLNRQLGETGVNKDYNVRAADAILASLPTRESISGGYKTARESLANYIKGIDTTTAGKAVGDIVGAIGGAIGVGSGVVSDIAGEASSLSGVGDMGNISKDLVYGSTLATLMGQENQALTAASAQEQEATARAGEARSSAARERRGIELQLAGAKGQRRASSLNPLDVANAFMSFQQNQRALSGYGSGSGGSGAGTTPVVDGQTVTPADLAAMAVSGKGAHEGLRGGNRGSYTQTSSTMIGYPTGSGTIGEWHPGMGISLNDWKAITQGSKEKPQTPYNGKNVPRGGYPGR